MSCHHQKMSSCFSLPNVLSEQIHHRTSMDSLIQLNSKENQLQQKKLFLIKLQAE